MRNMIAAFLFRGVISASLVVSIAKLTGVVG